MSPLLRSKKASSHALRPTPQDFPVRENCSKMVTYQTVAAMDPALPQPATSPSINDPLPDPEPAPPSLPEPDPGIYHPGKPPLAPASNHKE